MTRLVIMVVIMMAINAVGFADVSIKDKKFLESYRVEKDFMTQPLIDTERLADAIYLAEGGTKTKHPYGILTKYKHTTPRQACINTIKHALKDWNGQGNFIEFLGNRYAPIGALNDPTNLNKNWIKNVTYFYGPDTTESESALTAETKKTLSCGVHTAPASYNKGGGQ